MNCDSSVQQSGTKLRFQNVIFIKHFNAANGNVLLIYQLSNGYNHWSMQIYFIKVFLKGL